MLRTVLTFAVAASTASIAVAAPYHHHKPRRANLAEMNLTPRLDLVRRIPTRDFTPDRTPTSFNYSLPAPGLGGVVGYKPFVDAHPIQGYEVNQATALGFSQSASSVGASVGYKF